MAYRPDDDNESATGRRFTDNELASLLRDALEKSGEGWIEATAQIGYATTVDGSFDLAAAARHFVESIRAA